MGGPVEAQTSNAVLMVRPAAFGFNAETAASNAFARDAGGDEVVAQVRREFDGLADRLARAGVEVVVVEDSPEPPTPDAVFPNNWVSFHADGSVVTYPMAASSRRLERDVARVAAALDRHGFAVGPNVDLTALELAGHFLEGTGSLVLDRPHRRAFASRSPRTDPAAVAAFDRAMGYDTFLFDAFDRTGNAIYHTNVLLGLGQAFAILCLEVVPEEQRAALVAELERGDRTVVAVSYEQMCSFACNIMELLCSSGPLIAMSSAARGCLDEAQAAQLTRLGGELVDAAIPTIERVGGGSVRCMLADIHLPRRA